MTATARKISILSLLAVLGMTVFTLYKMGNSWEFALHYRALKIAAIAIVSWCVAYSTIAFQTLTNNRILTPSIMGFEAVFMLFQTLLVFIHGEDSLQAVGSLGNFIISTVLMIGFAFLLYLLIYKKGVDNMFLLLLIGLVLGTLLNTLSSFLQLLLDPNNFFIVQGKMFASFSNINQELLGYAFAIVAVVLLIGMRYTNRLDVLALGKNQAINLGLDYDKNIQMFLTLIAIMVAVSTALVGPVLFLGLLVSNLTYEILKTYKHHILIPACALVTLIVLVGGQFLAERILKLSTPISVIINFVGGIYFMYLLLKRKRI
ncbi:MAG: iron chelate uptake ABC transporter family permease subunit [Bacteroidetes bacterium]|jgi:iron complex transport system permease protein|nr:iron chelate uptake ABC transporter family permease subunit [Bacteroidota bacterium]